MNFTLLNPTPSWLHSKTNNAQNYLRTLSILMYVSVLIIEPALYCMIKEIEKPLVSKFSLHEAARVGDVELLKKFVERGNELEERNEQGETVLHCAVVSGNVEAVRYLIELGAQLEALDLKGRTPFMKAQSTEVAGYLKESGAKSQVCVTPPLLEKVKMIMAVQETKRKREAEARRRAEQDKKAEEEVRRKIEAENKRLTEEVA